jgi:hypothetical protein
MITRTDMMDRLAPSPAAPTKTFVLEVHADDGLDYLQDLVGRRNLEETADAYLHRVHADEGVVFWVDRLDDRFWNFHTQNNTHLAYKFLRNKVEGRRDLDWMWLPSEHLQQVWPGATTRGVHAEFNAREFADDESASSRLRVQLWGKDANYLLDYIAENPRYRSSVSYDSVEATLSDEDLGVINEGINRRGRFATSGESIEFHLQFVRIVVNRYRALVEACEHQAIAWTPFGQDGFVEGGSVQGGPITIRFSNPIADLDAFLEVVFSARVPYRLWGVPEVVNDVAFVEAVDLHIGHRTRIDVGSTWMRVYLEKGACGNTVARLISNLQGSFDSALTLLSPDLQAALESSYLYLLASPVEVAVEHAAKFRHSLRSIGMVPDRHPLGSRGYKVCRNVVNEDAP